MTSRGYNIMSWIVMILGFYCYFIGGDKELGLFFLITNAVYTATSSVLRKLEAME